VNEVGEFVVTGPKRALLQMLSESDKVLSMKSSQVYSLVISVYL